MKRGRVTKEQALEREERIFTLLGDRQKPATVQEVAFTAGLSYATASTILRKLADDGMVKKVGHENRRTLYSINMDAHRVPEEANEEVPAVDEVPEEVPEEVAAAPEPAPEAIPEPLPSVAINAVLRQIHLGKELEVIGFHLLSGDEQPLVDLRSTDGEIVTVSLVG